jgi:hypothetical protein
MCRSLNPPKSLRSTCAYGLSTFWKASEAAAKAADMLPVRSLVPMVVGT